MLKETITTGKSIEEAVAQACKELGVPENQCEIEVLDRPKKSLFGKIKVEARVKVTVLDQGGNAAVQPKGETATQPKGAPAAKLEAREDNHKNKLAAAVTYLNEILEKMELNNVKLDIAEKTESATITITGENLGILIGRHGDTLDALQYLTSLVCNRVEGVYYRITLDCGNYREKREEALKELAAKISAKVKRTGRSQILEPMNPYERRIIHSVVSDIEDVISKSKGDEPNRRIVIIPTNKNRPFKPNTNTNNNNTKPAYRKRPERTMEQILKGELSDEEKNTKLYSKIEF